MDGGIAIVMLVAFIKGIFGKSIFIYLQYLFNSRIDVNHNTP